ncbi:MAG: hypothetical protein ABSB66_17550, partial [Candidatus Acidiferrales bacterium]
MIPFDLDERREFLETREFPQRSLTVPTNPGARSTMTFPAQHLKGVVISLTAFLLVIQIAAVVLNATRALNGQTAFLVSYTAGQTIRSGNGRALYVAGENQISPDKLANSPVTALPFDRLAYQALLFVPLSLLSYRNAYWIFMAVNLALI